MLEFVRKYWRDIMGVVGFILYYFSDEIKPQLLGLKIPEVTFDPLIAIFAGMMILGAISFAYSGLSYALRKRTNTSIVYRKDLKKIPQLFSEAKSEVYVLSVTNEVFRQYVGDIVNLLKDNKRITFLFLKTKDQELIQKLEDGFNSANTAGQVDGVISMLKKAQSNPELTDEQKKNLEIRTYDLIPLHSIIAIDPKTDDGRMQVEFYAYRHDPTSRPNLVISKRKDPNLFKLYWTSLRFVLEHSEILDGSSKSLQETTMFLSADKPQYQPDQDAMFRGRVGSGDLLTLTIQNPSGEIVWRNQSKADHEGVFVTTYRLLPDTPIGSYQVRARSDAADLSSSFFVRRRED